MFIIPKGIMGAARAAPLFSIGEEQTFSECILFLRKKGEPPGRLPFLSIGEEQTFSECALSLRKKGSRPGNTLERPASDLRGDLTLEKRDKYL